MARELAIYLSKLERESRHSSLDGCQIYKVGFCWVDYSELDDRQVSFSPYGDYGEFNDLRPQAFLSWSRGGLIASQFRVEYAPYSASFHKVEAAYKAMKRINKRLESESISPTTFGQFLVQVAKAAGAKYVVDAPDDYESLTGYRYRIGDLKDLQYRTDAAIETFKELVSPAVASIN